MFARTLTAAAALALVAFSGAAQAADHSAAPAKLSILKVDTSDCFGGMTSLDASSINKVAARCPVANSMPDARRLLAMRRKLKYSLCTVEKVTDAKGKGSDVWTCEGGLTPAQLNRLNDYAVVALTSQIAQR